MKFEFRQVAKALAMVSALLAQSASAEQVKIAFIDGLSGPVAPIAQNQLKSFQMLSEMANQQ